MALEKKEFSEGGCRYAVEGPYSHGDVNAAIVRCEGYIDASTVSAFEDAIEYAFQQGYHTVLHMAGIDFICSRGCGTLIVQRLAGKEKGLEMMLIGIQEAVRETLEVLGLDDVLAHYATIDDALEEGDSTEKEIAEAVRGAF
ncbi:STAS domain-containing protein [Candidatus Woesearchaeota archaeon]|nr:STAS domain-containing protein [Candidatus Woesearchaeota archaeon]